MEIEHGPVGEGDLGQVATGGVHDPLGNRSGARCVENEQQILGRHVLGIAVIRRRSAGSRILAAQQLVPPVVAPRSHRCLGVAGIADPAGHDHVLHARCLGDRGIDIRLERRRRAAPPAAVRSDHHPGLSVEDPVPQRVGREPSEHHRVNRSDPSAGLHGHHQLGDHRHVDGHPVAASDTEAS